jgi:7-cyano-7-deazaguanine synthase in queuosine biosynthesis
MLSYLTTDRWSVEFVGGGYMPPPPRTSNYPKEDSVVLLSGGLDSFIGAVDLAASGKKPLAVSELVRGDAENQREFAAHIGAGLTHIQLHHNAHVPDPEVPPTQRARSVAFLSYGVLVATSLARYRAGGRVDLNICENGFISINPPLTGLRVGSLSTRTTHPVVLALLQKILNAAGLNVEVRNPYQFKTKGEMLTGCADQIFLNERAHTTTSCGRFLRWGYMHCGRCVPCLVRRAAFAEWGVEDATPYKFADLSIADGDHAGFDDVRAVGIAIQEHKEAGTERWLGASLSSPLIENHNQLSAVVRRGLDELETLLVGMSVR